MPGALLEDVRARRQVFGQRVLELRTRQGLTQEQLDERAGFDRKSVNRIENGGYSPSLDRVFVLAQALGVEVVELFDRRH